MPSIVDYYSAMPPVSRSVATLIFVCSVGVYTGLFSFQPFSFQYQDLLQFPPALHRLVTVYLLTMPKLGILFDTYFVYSYLSQMEKANPKFTRKEDLIWYLMVVTTVITILNQAFTGVPYYYLQALVISCCYTVTQDQRGQTAQIYFFNVPAQIMPYCLLLLRLIFDDGFTILMVACTGIFAAHFHDFCTRIYPEFSGGPNLLPTPWWISWIMETPRIRNTGYGSGYVQPRDRQTRSGPLPDSWRSAGPGRRLG